MNQVDMTTRGRRLNRRALVLLGMTAVVLIAGVGGLKAYQDRHGTRALLAEVNKRLERKQYSLALGYLNRYLELNPGDLDVLDLKAKVLAESAYDGEQAVAAMPIHNQVLGRDASRQETRRRLLELNLKAGRWEAALTLARELIKRGADDARAHRAVALALEGMGERGDAAALREACREYEAAEQKEPGDVASGERLARLYRERLDQPDRALEVLESLVRLNQGAPAKLALARLARARYFLSLGQVDRALDEVARAVEADPTNLEVRLAAAQLANQRGDTTTARKHLDAIPAQARGDLRIKAIEGLIEWREQRPDEAVRSWRAGLLQTGGNDADLTNWTALVLIDMGRVREAEPLIDQYRRLIGGNEPNPAYHYLHASYLLRTGQPQAAIQELEATRLLVDKLLEPDLYNLLGQCHEADHNEPKALEAYRKAASLTRTNSAPWLAIARLLWPKQPDAAIETIGLGLKALPGEPKLVINLARFVWERQMRLPKPQRSWAEVDDALALAERASPDSPDLARVRADYLFSIDKTNDALATLQAASNRNPKNVSLWLAQAQGLSRLGRSAEAFKVLDQATTSAGHHDPLIVTRASILLSQGHVKQAHAVLLDGLNRVPADRRFVVWKALGEFHTAQNDLAAARKAYTEYAQLQPDNREPKALLFDLAFSAGDEATIHETVEALKGPNGSPTPEWRLARIQELLRDQSAQSAGQSRETAPLDEAARLIAEAQASDPQAAVATLLEARLHEKRQATDKAITAYERALDQNGGQAALAPLVALLVREGRNADLDRIRTKTTASEVDRLAANQALKLGDKARAERLAARAVESAPQSADLRLWQAQLLYDLGKPKAAEDTLKAVITLRPSEPAPWLGVLNAQLAQKRAADAAATIEQIRSQVKTERPELLWAQCYQTAGLAKQANESYRAALKRWPDDLTVCGAAVAFYEQNGQRPEAERVLREVLQRDPSLSWASRRLALLLSAHRSDRVAWDEALQLVGSSAQPDDTPDDRLARAHVYAQGMERIHRDQAIQILQGLAAEQPRSSTVHERLARLLLAAGQKAEARSQAAQAANAENPTADTVLFYTGLLLAENALEDAERQLARLVVIDPQSLPVAEVRARLSVARGKGAEAADVLEHAFAARAASPEALSVGEKMVGLLIELKQSEAAERVARKLAELGPRGCCRLAEFLAQHGKVDQAASLLEDVAKGTGAVEAARAALELASRPGADTRWLELADRGLTAALKADPDSVDLLWKQAVLRRLQRRHQEEVALYRTVLARAPGSSQLLNDLAWALSEDLNKPQEALQEADEALRRNGSQPHILDTRGVILTRLDRLDDAIKDLEAAAQGLPIGPVYYHLARAYRMKGRAVDFEKCRRRAQELGLTPEQLQPSERDDWARNMN